MEHYIYMFNRKFIIVILLIISNLTISGCGPLIVAGAASTFAMIADRRTTGTIIEDNSIELKALKNLSDDDDISKNSKISVTSYNERVLLTGQANSEYIKSKIVDAIKQITKVRTIYNEIQISKNASFSSSSYDTWLTTKVKTKLTANTKISTLNMKITTNNKTVYLMGLVTPEEANIATEITRKVAGVQKVVKLFEYIDNINNDS
jgi:osmotically-inducible protein OsmY